MGKIDDAESAKKILTEPYPPELTATEERVRRNLLVGVTLSLIFTLADLHIAEGSGLFGIRFQSIPDLLVYKLLLGFTLYQLIHFIVISNTAFRYWRIRVAGVKVIFQTHGTVGGDDGRESIQDPKQSSLYTWWQEKSLSLSKYQEAHEAIRKLIEANTEAFEEAQMLTQTRKSADEIERYLSRLSDILEHERIRASLYRFDNWYEAMSRWQHIRWFVFDLAFPIAGGALSCFLLTLELLG